MGREVRRVPKNWKHPKDKNGDLVPMHKDFPYEEEEITEGIAEGWLKDTPPNYGCEIMPSWPEEEKTHIMMYEDCSEGTPISPAFETPEELARWLTGNNASTFANMTASYDQWLSMCKKGWAVSAVLSNGELKSGVEGLYTQSAVPVPELKYMRGKGIRLIANL